MLQISNVDENHHFLTHSAKNPAKNPMFLQIYFKNYDLCEYAEFRAIS